MARKLDILLWGATGFTGRLVADYLAAHAPEGLTWALGGRNQGKLDNIQGELAADFPDNKPVPVLVGDSSDRSSLELISKQAKVVCTTVGPYAKHGSNLVAACISTKTHYCDITGEIPWIRRMIVEHHDAAAAAKVRIVNCCGYDSIPSDLGCLLLQTRAVEQLGAPFERVWSFAADMKGTMSGGSVASLMLVLAEARHPEGRRAIGNPYSLSPPGTTGPDGSDYRKVAKTDLLDGQWTGPFIMSAVNNRIVRRTNALRDFEYGQSFGFSEAAAYGKGLRGFLRASATTAALGGLVAGLSTKASRRLLSRFLPAPGEGPSPSQREAGHFKHILVGESNGARLSVEVRGDLDPGYGSTAIMLGESAICLAKDGRKLPKRFGLLTPGSALGLTLIDRLNADGIRFE